MGIEQCSTPVKRVAYPVLRLQRIAVYGTLREGLGIVGTPRLDGRVTRLGRCRIPGTLIDLGPYPALSTEPSAAGVIGELLRIEDHTLLEELDRYEGVEVDAPATSAYVRVKMLLLEPAVEAWVYRAGITRAGIVIPHGDWRRWLEDGRRAPNGMP